MRKSAALYIAGRFLEAKKETLVQVYLVVGYLALNVLEQWPKVQRLVKIVGQQFYVQQILLQRLGVR